jgi:glycosyltransferase involved in cell wall biosynthesis
MKITIVTPSYNQGQFIEETITSIWNQEGDFELEHIIADGGSIDNSVKIIEKYNKLYKASSYPFKCKKFSFTWWSKKDNGQVDVLNRGFDMARGEILGWINSDDSLATPHALQDICNIFNKKISIVTGNTYIIDQNSNVVGTYMLSSADNDEFQKALIKISNGCIISQPSTFFKKAVWKDLGINPYPYTMDWDLWIRAYKKGYTFYKIKDYIANFRVHKDSKSEILPLKAYQERLYILRREHVVSIARVYYEVQILVFHISFLRIFINHLAGFMRSLMSGYKAIEKK